jgi:putative flippase GtrA
MHPLRTRPLGVPIQLFIGYASVSVFVTCIDLGILHSLVNVRMPQPIGVSIAFLTANGVQFSLYRYVVFRALQRPVMIQGSAYVLVLVISWWLTVALVALITHLFGVATMLAKLFTIPITFPLGFLLNRYVIFRQPR